MPVPKTWFVTGTSSGFGRAFADYALAQGDAVVATARDPARLADLAAQAPDRVLTLALDVEKPGAAQAAVDAAVARFGGIDVLVNNAGRAIVGAVEETPEAELRALMETNFFGAMAVIRAALPVLRAQRRGAIVTISSLNGQASIAGIGAYSASKFALEGLSEALAREMAPFGVKVLIVEPGAFRTAIAGSALRVMPAFDAYADTAGATRDRLRRLHGAQTGDPAKVPPAVARALAAEHTPLRLQLGADAVAAVRDHAEALLADLAAWEDVALATRLDDG
jgi:NAD(P)-dependent dehydrogenase (short-subunit alcohol dehydrogenase family)